MRREGLSSSLCSTIVLILIHMTANNSFAQSAIQSPSCSGVIHGIVSDRTGQPVGGITVVAWPLGVDLGAMLPRLKTNQGGEYSFEHVCPGRYAVLAEDAEAGYPDSSPYLFEFLYGRRTAQVKLTAKHSLAELPVQLPPQPGRIKVFVTDRVTGVEITKFTIEMIVPGQHHSPEIKYEFSPEIHDREIEVPPDKDVIMHVTADGFREWSASASGRKVIRVSAGTQESLLAQLESHR